MIFTLKARQVTALQCRITSMPGKVVEFTADGKYVIWGAPKHSHRSVIRYRCHDNTPPRLDVWIARLLGPFCAP